jgi:alpha-glucosidase
MYNANRPEVHEVHRRWRAIAEEYDPPRLLVGETFVDDVATMASYYGAGDQLQLCFNIPLVQRPFELDALREVVEDTERAIPDGSWPVWTGGNHDVSRFPTRWAGGDPYNTRLALLMVLALRGTAFLYYGDELGLVDTEIPPDRTLDPVGITYPGFGRDPERTPMPWSPEPGAGFTTPGVEPWLPFGDLAATNVVDQRRDPASTLSFTRDVIQLRAAVPDLATGDYATVTGTPDGVWAWTRGERVLVVLNFTEHNQALDGVSGLLRITTTQHREGERVEGTLALVGLEGAIVWLDAP